MIKIQLWRGNTMIHEESVTPKAGTEEPLTRRADAVLDRLITDIHAGRHGEAPIRLTADFFDKTGRLFRGRHARLAVSELHGAVIL